ncbi:MAG: hypothetical protein GY775_01135 [Candidatus Scalindua sp.]|nr:hypothetical protein [Candidatus Scalindua sp.]
MATDNIDSAVVAIIKSKSNITSLLGFYPNSTIPIVNSGVLAKQVTGLPAIAINDVEFESLNQVMDNDSYIINCFAKTMAETKKIAKIIIKELDDTNETIDGFSMRFAASGLPTNGDPTAKEINTPVLLRVTNWR